MKSQTPTPTFTGSGTKAATAAKPSSAVFGVEVTNHQLLKQAYEAYLANGRDNLAVTKTRGLVRGGGKKPWKQKGTGRARFGSSRNPIWRGGGIVFGPTGQENYSVKISTKSKRVALRQALSLAHASGKLIVMEKLASKNGKTADMAKLLAKVGVTRDALVVVDEKTPELIMATANLQNVMLVTAKYLNVFDIMNADHIVMTSDALKTVETWLQPEKAQKTQKAEVK
ncbi:50S ribosomal protein L4 [Candidatus Saccharibacteria bacterium]|nr:ribosomal protein L4 [uncultured bacterium]PID30603.1 MAG: 50S ribosomal protein L4 [Candidatus Saccharibacteria bacterium]PID99316.1 MAG: 50S ribosomal protein L4 [Candidatus Saccharibacteria bacterium]